MPEPTPQPRNADRVRLTPDETAELAARLSELTRGGLPLGDGLRAVADEQPRSQEATGLRRLAARIDAGAPLDAALREASLASSVTPAMQRLLLLGARHYCLPELLEQSVHASASRAMVRRQLWTAATYPIILMLGMCVLWFVLERVVVTPFYEIYGGFQADLPEMFAVGRMGMTMLAVLVGLLLLGPVAFRLGRRWEPTWWILTALPLLGPMWRWQSFAELCRGLGTALGGSDCRPGGTPSEPRPSSPPAPRTRLPMPEALRLASAGIADVELVRQCNEMIDRLEHGLPAAEVFAHADVFPADTAAVFQWAERHDAWPEAFESLSTWYEGLLHNRVHLIETVFPPVMVFLVAIMLVMVNIALLEPLVSVIRWLT
ncbi:MAG: type II secretion system F family protein [Thermoguttaceae bacterium]|jgi:type II secretory pathway component PulF|nr:type II secretion system F family protein [Thermoguttaceae bacterium]